MTAVVGVGNSTAQQSNGFPGAGRMPYQVQSAPSPYGADRYGLVPRPPSQPMPVSRPVSWPGTPTAPRQWNAPPRYGAAAMAAQPQSWPGAAPSPSGQGIPMANHVPWHTQHAPPPPELQLCEGTLILAKVGSEVILARDLLEQIDSLLSRSRSKLPPEKMEAQRQRYRDEVQQGINDLAAHGGDFKPSTQAEMERSVLIRQLLKQQIETKLAYCDAKHKIPKEGFPRVEKDLSKKFEEIALEKLMKQHGVGSRRELEAKLRASGSSIEKRRRAFIQQALSEGWMREQIDPDGEITYDQMMEYYREHLAEFETPARARWHELMVRFSQHASKEEAFAAIAWMGNQVQAGASFEQIAAQHSDGITASQGGRRDWTDRGSLVCEEIDQAIFGLPLGQLSRIITSKTGYHIVRAVERKDVTRTSFLEAQVEIREKIRNQRIQQQLRAYVSRLREQVPVWTIFDEQTTPQDVAGRPAPPRR